MRIKVTGYMDTDDISAGTLDTSHSTGLSEQGYEDFTGVNGAHKSPRLSDLEDLDFELQR